VLKSGAEYMNCSTGTTTLISEQCEAVCCRI